MDSSRQADGSALPPGVTRLSLRRYQGELRAPENDLLVVEEPLEIRYDREAVATLMRTPGDDRDLALGYLYGEGWIDALADVGALAVCGQNGAAAEDGDELVEQNVAALIPAPGRRPPSGVVRRATITSASCGVCGKRTIEEAMALRPPSQRSDRGLDALPAELLARLPERLRAGQELFRHTGALHAAGLFDACGRLSSLKEDIGRHNAVDKVLGEAFRNGALPLASDVLQVSGRVSFEIVQKAYRAGIPCVAAVSGVSSLAVELARGSGITLVGFVRGGAFCVYSHPERLRG